MPVHRPLDLEEKTMKRSTRLAASTMALGTLASLSVATSVAPADAANTNGCPLATSS